MPTSLLAHIASNFITQYENVANASVCYLLNEYPAARAALAGLLGVGVPNHYAAEEATGSGSRPDITGKDAEGRKTVVIEGKFWANLTDNQPNDYLAQLAEGGRLLFLVPDKRIVSLKAELAKRVGSPNDTSVLVYSWHHLLDLVEKENNRSDGNTRLAGDLAQLTALCDKMAAAGMPPLTQGDLDPMVGRITTHLVDVIDDCHAKLGKLEYMSFKGLNRTPQKYGYGFYFVAFGRIYGWLGFSSNHWHERDNHNTPFWMSVLKMDRDQDTTINDALRSFDPESVYENELAIVLKPGMDKNQVVDHIVSRVDEVLAHLNSKVEQA